MVEAPDAARLQRFIDKSEIEDVLTRWTVAFDEADWPALRACVAPDVIQRTVRPDTGEPDEVHGVDAVIAICEERRAWFDVSQHFHVSVIVDVDGDTARARAFHLGYLVAKGEQAPAAGSFRGVYTLRRTPAGGWIIIESDQLPGWFIWPAPPPAQG